MKRKAVGISLILIGVMCLCSAAYIKWYEGEAERRVLIEREQSVRNSVFLVQQEDALIEVNAPVDELVDFISGVDTDQEIAEVKTYKNVLDIPKIECQAYIGNGTTAYNLSRGVGRHSDTVKVGEIGNCVVAGHASRSYKCIFNRLEEMQILDEFFAYDANGTKHTYTVIERFVCSPNQMSILNNTDDGRSTMTIYTCTEGGTMRFVLVGTEFTEDGLKEFKESYFSDKISHLRTLNMNFSVEEVCSLLDMRDTKRTYLDDSYRVIFRPWSVSDEAMFTDIGVLNFGIEFSKGVVPSDVA